jgi:hypothetical protein
MRTPSSIALLALALLAGCSDPDDIRADFPTCCPWSGRIVEER